MKCPNGHDVGTAWESRKCTQLVCGEKALPPLGKPLPPKKGKKKYEPPPKLATDRATSPKAADDDDTLTAAHALFLQRVRAAGVPANLGADEAAAWAQKKLAELLPEAVAELQHQLRYGTERQRADAVDRVLNANGMAKKEANNATGSTIIVNLAGDMSKIPFLQRTVDAVKKGE
jgi:hypothetical protein